MSLTRSIRAMLFGDSTFRDWDHPLVREVSRHVDLEDLILARGGFARVEKEISQDLDAIVEFIVAGNRRRFEGSVDPAREPRLASALANHFFNALSAACRGDLHEGATANSARDPPPEYRRPTDEVDDHRRFANVLRLYDVKCRSVDRLLDPFSLVLVPALGHVDAEHWQTEHALREFVLRNPRNRLSESVAATVRSTLRSLLEARVDEIPPDDAYLIRFVQNLNVIDRHIEKVGGSNTPPKLVDLILRLLAKSKKDHLWMEEGSLPPPRKPPVCTIHLRNAQLEAENRRLRAMLR